MKFRASKKTILILIMCFLLLVLAILGFIFKDKIQHIINIRDFYNLDKYSEFLQNCDVERKRGEIVLHCRGVLKETVLREDEECIKVEVLINGDTDLRSNTLCVKTGKLDWGNPYGITGLIPVNMYIGYKRSGVFDYLLDSIRLTVLSDDELSELFEKNSKLENLKSHIWTEEAMKMIHDNYNFVEGVSLRGIDLPHILFFDFLLKSVSSKNNNLYLLFEGKVKGQVHDIVLHSKRFFSANSKTGSMTLITTENYEELKINQQYDVMIMSSNSIFPKEIEVECSLLEESIPKDGTLNIELFSKELFALCVTKPDKLKDMYIPDLEGYITSSVQEAKSGRDTKTLNLDKVVLFSVTSF